MFFRKHSDLFVLIAVASWTFVVLLERGASLLALPFIVAVPGYAIMTAIFPFRSLSKTHQLMITIGLNLAVLILTGLALNRLPWGLEARSWMISLYAVTLMACVVAFVRRRGRAVPLIHLFVAVTPRQTALLVLAAGLLGIAYLLAGSSATKPTSSFTQFWLLPINASSSPITDIQLGIQNDEGKQAVYRLILTHDGDAVQQWDQVTVGTGETWTGRVRLPAGIESGTLEATLYRADSPDPYRVTRMRLG